MRFRFPLFVFLFIAGSLAIPHFVHAGIPFWGPIIDKTWTVSASGIQCALGWGAFMTVINNIIQLLITLAIIFVAPLMIAWAGFLMVVNQGNAGKLTEAKGILINTVVGIVLALAGWMIVDAVMAVLYSGSTGSSTWGTWSSLVTSSGPACLPQQGVGTGLNPATVPPPGLGVVPPGTGTSGENITNATSYLDAHAQPASTGQCATYVRQAIAAGGLSSFSGGLNTDAKNYGPLLTNVGFTPIGSDNSSPQKGDVVVIQNYPGGSTAGHIAMYDGSKWVSDFVQQDFWGGSGYRTSQPAHTFYRP